MTQILAILVAVGIVLGVGFILSRPRWAVVMVIVMYPLEQLLQAYFPFLIYNKWVVNVSVGLLAIFAVATRVFRREPVLSGYRNAVTFMVGALYALVWIGLIWTPSREFARQMLLANIPYVILLLILLPLLLGDLADFRRVMIGVMLLGSIIAVMILLNPSANFLAGRLTVDIGFFAGQRGGRTNPLALATLGGLMALTAVLIRFDRPTTAMTLLRVVAFIFGLGLAIVSGSRGQVLAVAFVGVLFYPFARRVADMRQFFLTCFGLAVIGVGLYVTFRLFIGEQNQERWSIGGMFADSTTRLDMALDLLHAYLASPSQWFFGLGTSAFTSVTSYSNITYVHNIAVEVLCELGIIGASCLAVLLWAICRTMINLWRLHRFNPDLSSVVALCGALVVYSLLLALKQGSFALNATIVTWWVAVAKIASHELRSAAAAGAWQRQEAWVEDDVPAPDGEEPEGGYALARPSW